MVRYALLLSTFAVVGCHKSAVTSAVEDAYPGDASVPVEPRDAAQSEDAGATYRVRPETGSWLAAIGHEKGFRSFALPGSGTVHVTWSHAATRRVRDVPPAEDYGSNYVARVRLRLERAGVTQTIDFGEEPGGLVPSGTSFCKAPKPDGVVTSFAVGTMQGDDEHRIMRGPATLYVMHRQTSDGSCQEGKQGPLDICLGSEWHLRAIVSVSGDPDFDESLSSVDPIVCTGGP